MLIHIRTTAISKTKQDWNEDSLLKALDNLQEETSPCEPLQQSTGYPQAPCMAMPWQV